MVLPSVTAHWAGCHQSDFHERQNLLDSEHECHTVSGVALSIAKNVRCTFTKCARAKIIVAVDLISDALPFGRLWYGEPNAISNAIGLVFLIDREAASR
jgi:hypothetical protein